MATPRPLSASVNGRPIPIVNNASPGDLVHQVPLTSRVDRVTIVATNSGIGGVIMTVELGGVAVTDRLTIAMNPKTQQALVTDVPITSGEVRIYANQVGVSVVGHVVRE